MLDPEHAASKLIGPTTEGARAGDKLSKDQMVLAMLAALGGDQSEVNERDLFLACWHAFPNAMRWADTALPNPDTFTASLRRMDADGLIVRLGKQLRGKVKKAVRPSALDVGRSGVVKAKLRPRALERANIKPEQVEAVRRLAARPEEYAGINPSTLIAISIAVRLDRVTDEGSLLETAFHKFPGKFAYKYRPEFPDVEAIRDAIEDARVRGLLAPDWGLTEAGRAEVALHSSRMELRGDSSQSFATGAFRLAERIQSLPGYARYLQTRSVKATKGDELFRALRLPPTTDHRRIATALLSHARELRRIDRGDVLEYLIKLAELRNPDALALAASEEPLAVVSTPPQAGGA